MCPCGFSEDLCPWTQPDADWLVTLGRPGRHRRVSRCLRMRRYLIKRFPDLIHSKSIYLKDDLKRNSLRLLGDMTSAARVCRTRQGHPDAVLRRDTLRELPPDAGTPPGKTRAVTGRAFPKATRNSETLGSPGAAGRPERWTPLSCSRPRVVADRGCIKPTPRRDRC